MRMRKIVDYIKGNGTRSGYEISDYARNVLGYPDKSAGGCLARAYEYSMISIVGVTWVNGKQYNVYA